MWYNKKEYTEPELITGMFTNDESVFRYIYRKHFDSIKKLVYSFHNINLNAGDIFQEGLTRAVINIRNGRFEGKSSFPTYLSGICRNVCRKEIMRMPNVPLPENYDEPEQEDTYQEELIKKITELKKKMSEECIKIIDLRFGLDNDNRWENENKANRKFEEIATLLNIETDNARQRFGRCLEKLTKLVNDYVDELVET